MAKVNYGWLKTYNNEYFAPKSILSQLYTDDGVALSTYLFNNYSPRASVGNVKNPVYMDNGDPKACGDLLETSITGIATALATVGADDAITNVAKGAADTPVYFANGVPVACSGKLAFSITGNADGTATALTSKNIGSATTAPVFFNASGQPQVCTSLNINTSGSAAKLSAADKGSAVIPVYFSGGVPVQCNATLEVSITGNAGTATNATNATNTTNVNIAADTTSKLYVLGATTTGNTRIYRESSVYMSGNVLYGAAWNDYAEYRKQEQKLLPGFCVKSTDNGILNYTTKRLEPCEGVVSDTFGFAIGKTDECKTPLAVAGRVLVYTEEERENFHFGDAVCASANGRVSKMTREEIKEYPDRIIGIVSEIPDYETWGEGNIAVNNRIWIKVK